MRKIYQINCFAVEIVEPPPKGGGCGWLVG